MRAYGAEVGRVRASQTRTVLLRYVLNQPLSCLRGLLRAHLFHPLSHALDMARIAAFYPGFIPLCGFFQISEELLIHKLLPSLRHRWPHPVPDPEKLATGLKETILVEQAVIEHGTGLIPIREHHHRQPAFIRSRPGNSHPIIEIVHVEVLEEPFSPLA